MVSCSDARLAAVKVAMRWLVFALQCWEPLGLPGLGIHGDAAAAGTLYRVWGKDFGEAHPPSSFVQSCPDFPEIKVGLMGDEEAGGQSDRL